MADLWHPFGGIFISNLGEKRYLFQFFHIVDMNRVMAGTPWFFNNHLFLLYKIQPEEDPMLVSLLSTEFWVQVHDMPPSCGKLGHGESFCPISVRIDLSKITFGWDISLCATTRRRITLTGCWLRKADGSICRILDKESGDNRCNGKDDRDMRQIWRDDLERLYPNPNYIPLVPRIDALNSEVVNQQNMVNGVENWATNESRPMDLILERENDPLQTMDGKKHRRLVAGK
ncbi:hypothetical protein Gorai_021329 [Gossypium raimondii]|uniref:DUF4283 domain-containing protein n=1 Tax=Gossypium raimondii TaxID=29730 RepID=A0A7J8NQK5_GOSRA|nr:hypothetical protein [Gossypium raimondii]